jgi:hypothetical protein
MSNYRPMELYYIPVYTIRGWADEFEALSYVIKCLANNEKIRIYKDKDKARKEADSYLCDDDTSAVVTIEYYPETGKVHMLPILGRDQIHFKLEDFIKYCNIVE